MKRNKEIVIERSQQEVQPHLHRLSEVSSSLAVRIGEKTARTNKSVALSNFCHYVSGELHQLSVFYPENLAGMAWASRNLFESNLIVRFVLADEANFNAWLGQMLRDESDFIDGVLSTVEGSSMPKQQQLLQSRLSQLKDMALRHGIAPSKPFSIADLAKTLHLHDEYVSLYKLFSKYVHPSSLLINAWQRQTPSSEWTNIFLIKAQIYAGDSISRIQKACGLPESVA